MKIAYRGHLYEYQTDLFMSDDEAKNRYADDQEDIVISELENNGSNDISDDLSNTNVPVKILLRRWNLKGHEVGDDWVFEELSEYFIIRNREIVPVSDLIDNLITYFKEFPEFVEYEQSISDDFWTNPIELFHATNCDNVEDILKTGLDMGYGTGMTNRREYGVFTSENVDGYIDSYGECKFGINTQLMKADGVVPLVKKEPEVFDYMLSTAIGRKYGINVDRYVDESGGMDHGTWIITSGIDPKYLSLAEDGRSESDY